MKKQFSIPALALLAVFLGAGSLTLFNAVEKVVRIDQLDPQSLTAAVSGSGSGLVAHYTFDEGNGTAAEDSAGSNDGMLTGGPTWTSGKVGSGALSFDGVDDHVLIPHSSNLNPSEITIAGWIKFVSMPPTNNFSIVEKGGTAGYRIRCCTIQFLHGGNLATASKQAVPAGSWTHFAVTSGAAGTTYYIDGVSQGTHATPYAAAQPTAPLKIGRVDAPLELDDIRIYNRVLTGGEISELYDPSSNVVVEDNEEETDDTNQDEPLDDPISNPPPADEEPEDEPAVPSGTCRSNTYYIDFENGNDANDGKCTGSPWKHVPGSTDATGVSKTATLKNGDTLQFKGGVVYRGRVALSNKPNTYTSGVTLKGTGWGSGKAIISGADLLNASWTKCDASCGKNWPNLYQATIGSEYTYTNMDLFDDSGFLYIAQDPNLSDPFWSDNINEFRTVKKENLTLTTIKDPLFINQADPNYYKNAYVSVWVNPNVIATVKITGYNPSTNTISFASLGPNALYGDRDQKYSIINALDTVDRPGEYYFDEINHKIILYPKGSLNTVEIGSRSQGIVYAGYNNLTIDGFVIEKIIGSTGAYSVTDTCCQSNQNITLKNNEIRYARLRSAGNQATVKLGYSDFVTITDNSIHDNETTGVSVGGTGSVEGNSFYKNGYKGLWVTGGNHMKVVDNTFSDHGGTHGTDVSIFTSTDVLFANNIIANSGTEVLSFENDTNLIIHGNLLIGAGANSGVIRQNGTNMKGYLIITNNTILGSGNNIGLNSGASSDPAARYIVKNNIIDGWSSASVKYEVSNNIYTGLSWNQLDRYGWYLMPGESVETNLSSIFQSTSNEFNGGYKLKTGSVAQDTGVSLNGLLPADVRTKFPDFDFTTDRNNTPRPQGSAWDMGAYEYYSGQPTVPPISYPVADTTPPTLSSITSTPSLNTTLITWSSNEPTTTQVQYGLTTSYGSASALSSTLKTSHSVSLTNLTPNTLYNYRVISKDVAGNTTTSQNGTFSTSVVAGTGPSGSGNTSDITTNVPPPNTDGSSRDINARGGNTITTSTNQTILSSQTFIPSTTFTRYLTIGSTGTDVKALQQALNSLGYTVSVSGAGSKGQETIYFGPATTQAIQKFQCAVLKVCAGSLGYGNFGPLTRAALNARGGGTTSVVTTTLPVTAAAPISTTFTRNLTLGSTGPDVKALQVFLNAKGFTVSTTGGGSPGNETLYFGPATQRALARYQAANNITPAVGYFGPLSREKVNAPE